MAAFSASYPARHRVRVMEELRRLLPVIEGRHRALAFGVETLDSHLPGGGLACGALHEFVPHSEHAIAAALGFMMAILARLLSSTRPIVVVMPAAGLRPYGRLAARLFGHGLAALGLDPARLILVETKERKDTLWAIAEALRSGAPAAVAGVVDRLDLKLSQKLQLTASDCGLPLLLLRPAASLDASAAATRWRIGAAPGAHDRFGLFMRPRWHLHLERCRNGRPGQWVVEYDHVAHCFSLAAALADPAPSRDGGEESAAKTRCA